MSIRMSLQRSVVVAIAMCSVILGSCAAPGNHVSPVSAVEHDGLDISVGATKELRENGSYWVTIVILGQDKLVRSEQTNEFVHELRMSLGQSLFCLFEASAAVDGEARSMPLCTFEKVIPKDALVSFVKPVVQQIQLGSGVSEISIAALCVADASNPKIERVRFNRGEILRLARRYPGPIHVSEDWVAVSPTNDK